MPATLLRFGAVVLFALCAVACADDGGSDSPAPGDTPMGRTFLSTSVDGTPIPGGGPLTLRFADGRVSANAGCNTTTGPVTFDGDVLRVGELAGTLMGCPGERADADQWVARLLNATPTWQLADGTLTLRADGQTVELLDKKIAQPDKPVRDTLWTVTELLTPEARIRAEAIDQAAPTLRIAQDGAVTGSAGCNQLTGTAEVSDGAATFRVATTRMLCPPAVMEIEQSVLRALDGHATLTVDADLLTLRNDNGSGLSLRAT
ncbi:META domain-containing protein [Nocardia harenae]|uniref:META domain-containing protein n=1 Tax=Nocardia harenae TaxID=358707 RepID=UPI0009FDD8F2|nr:META domain-containing protein [Nocardia harenae]